MSKGKSKSSKASLVPKREVCFEKCWDSFGPDFDSAGGCETLYRVDGKFWYASDLEGDVGPFESLREALEQCDDLVAVTEATVDVSSSMLSSAEIVSYLQDYSLGETVNVEINGEFWRLESGEWTRVDDF